MATPLLPLLLTAAPGMISGVANLFWAKRRRQEEDKATAGISQLADIFRQQLSGDYFDTAEAQGAMTGILQNQQQNQNAINSTAASTGMTDEARIAMMGRNNEATAGGMSDLARSADLWRSRLLNQHQGALSNLYQVGQQNRQNFNNSLSNILNPLSEGIAGGFNSGAFDSLFKKEAPVQGISDNNNLTGLFG